MTAHSVRGRLAAAALLALLLPAPTAGQTLTLREAAEAALAHHPGLGAASARVEAAAAGSDAARGGLLPGVVLDGGVTRFQEPMVVAPLHGFDPMRPPAFDRTLVQGRLGVAYTLFDGGARDARVRGADATLAGVREQRRDAEMALLDEVTSAYLAAATAREVEAAARALVQALDAEAEQARRRVDQGTAARVELLRAEAARSDAAAQAATAAAARDLAERTLARTMGVGADAVTGRTLAGARPAAPLGEGDTPPAVAAAARAVAVAEARLADERARRAPTVDAGAGLLTFGSGAGDFTTEWQAGLQLSFPIFTGGARAASVRRARAEVDAARETLRGAELAADAARDAARAAVAEAAARADALEASVTQWEEVARIEALALESGAGVQTDLLRAQAALFQARAGRSRARADLALAHVRLARARGALTLDSLTTLLEMVP